MMTQDDALNTLIHNVLLLNPEARHVDFIKFPANPRGFVDLAELIRAEATRQGFAFTFQIQDVSGPTPATSPMEVIETVEEVKVHKCPGCGLGLPKTEFNGRIFHQEGDREFECSDYTPPGTVSFTKGDGG